ncbi:sugar-transfer associated ATP-grasp domain-containing protein [Pararhodonellum marinum]|uniref:sugar-transfer associated ATP-grasp domain-containing protein n=1 Tax=Pararhodonellum marinum TaxID=2755358 RepID=UPI001890415B|nr:sugar-transfer associated ATP-grasp domain-containing protein [Pararhodonellum marinum]
MNLRRLIYLGYYFKVTNAKTYWKFLNHTRNKSGKNRFQILFDNFFSVFKYNISILEYFQFHFYELSDSERKEWAGTGFMYETINRLNPKSGREIFSNKTLFIKNFKDFINHLSFSLNELEKDPLLFEKLRSNNSGKLILKSTYGQCGRGIVRVDTKDLTFERLKRKMKETNNDIAEEFVNQHPDLMKLSPSGLNTLRLITQLNNQEEVEFLGARLRITINSIIDNLAAGNIAAPVDLNSGMVEGPGVYSDITKEDVYVHPLTSESIVGFQVPFFKESIELVKKAALSNKINTSIGWDVAITADGPSLIEGNHDWCKLLWQLPVKKGLKKELEKYIPHSR